MADKKSPNAGLASQEFDAFCAATTLKTILGHHRHLCELLRLRPSPFPQFYPKLKSKLSSWKAKALWAKFDKRASHKCYNRGKACPNTKLLIIGGGPCGLRTAIEAQLLGAKVVVLEKRDRISRHNVLHLWPFVIHDLKALNAKKFFGKFCAGAIDHISIRQLQYILLKVALILGVEFHEGVCFESLIPPPEDQNVEKNGWRAKVTPADHPVSQYEFDVLIGADGKRNTLEGFKRKEFRGKLAIAITANFINRRTEAEARVEEISGVAFIFNQKFFKDLYAETGIDLENIVYYKDETHYFVMTAKKHSLISSGVILNDYPDTIKLLSPENKDQVALMKYARDAAEFSTNYIMQNLEFAVDHYGQPDVAMFDFTSMFAAENASRVVERHGYKLLQMLVGDSLLEPFWPTGSGCARGFLSSMDACWAIKNWGSGQANVLEVLAERESIYRILGQTTPENLQRDYAAYTLDPHSRYPNLNKQSVNPIQVKQLFDTDDPAGVELPQIVTSQDMPKKRRRKDSQVHPDTLLHWLKKQIALYDRDVVHIENVTSSFKNGLALCAIIHRYRPDLIEFQTLKPEDVAKNNQLAFDILERELGVPPVMTGLEMEQCDIPDKLTMLAYLSQIYDTFRGEIPHIKHPKLEPETKEEPVDIHEQLRHLKPEHKVSLLGRITGHAPRVTPNRKRVSTDRDVAEASATAHQRLSSVEKKPDPVLRKPRKRRSQDKLGSIEDEERLQRIEEIRRNRYERQLRKQYIRKLTTQQFFKSMQMLETNARQIDDTPFEDYSLFVYRQTAPNFTDRIKEMERKILYPDREARIQEEIRKGANPDENLSDRVKLIEEKLRGKGPAPDKKPKDLNRAIGKIERSDWNVKEIEKKIQENKMGRGKKSDRGEKVPKWSREQFDDKFQAMKTKLQRKSVIDKDKDKYADIDVSLKRLDRKIKEGSVLDMGQRGANKVSALAEQLAYKTQEPEKPAIQKSSSKAALVLPSQGGSEACHFCNKRVYLMERLSAEGKFFHRGCFRCEYCSTTLRLGNYAFDRDGRHGSRFFCIQHFGQQTTAGGPKIKARRKSEELRIELGKENVPTKTKAPTPKSVERVRSRSLVSTILGKGKADAEEKIDKPDAVDVGEMDGEISDEDGHSEMDEDEWTDVNFGASAAEGSSDSVSDMSDSEEEEAAEALEAALEPPEMTAAETRRLAEKWTKRHSGGVPSTDKPAKLPNNEDNDEEDDDDDDESGSYDDDGSDEGSEAGSDYDSDDDESDTATEGEDEIQAREQRRLEVPLDKFKGNRSTDSGSDTEVKILSLPNDKDAQVSSLKPAKPKVKDLPLPNSTHPEQDKEIGKPCTTKLKAQKNVPPPTLSVKIPHINLVSPSMVASVQSEKDKLKNKDKPPVKPRKDDKNNKQGKYKTNIPLTTVDKASSVLTVDPEKDAPIVNNLPVIGDGDSILNHALIGDPTPDSKAIPLATSTSNSDKGDIKSIDPDRDSKLANTLATTPKENKDTLCHSLPKEVLPQQSCPVNSGEPSVNVGPAVIHTVLPIDEIPPPPVAVQRKKKKDAVQRSESNDSAKAGVEPSVQNNTANTLKNLDVSCHLVKEEVGPRKDDNPSYPVAVQRKKKKDSLTSSLPTNNPPLKNANPPQPPPKKPAKKEDKSCLVQ